MARQVSNKADKKSKGKRSSTKLLLFAVVLTFIFLVLWFTRPQYTEDTATTVGMLYIRMERHLFFETDEYVETAVYVLDETYQSPVIIAEFDRMMLEINPDFVCWIYIRGTNIDYPVVRAKDNEKYLELTFFGEIDRHGAIFMDYRNVGDIVPHIIIYGHNTADGTKFGSLRYFLNDNFLQNNQIITLITNGRTVEYRIFSVRLTDIYDPAYFLDFSKPGSFSAFLERNGAPYYAAQILTLSTCVSRGRDYDRLIVQGVLIK